MTPDVGHSSETESAASTDKTLASEVPVLSTSEQKAWNAMSADCADGCPSKASQSHAGKHERDDIEVVAESSALSASEALARTTASAGCSGACQSTASSSEQGTGDAPNEIASVSAVEQATKA